MDKKFLKNFRFHVKLCTVGKVEHLLFSKFLLVLPKCLFWEKVWSLRYNPEQFCDFSEVFWFPTTPSVKSFSNSRGNSYIPLNLLITTLYLAYGVKKLW